MSDTVLFRTEKLQNAEKHIGVVSLNSEKTLNSLSLEMIEAMQAKLDFWKDDSSIAAVFIEGNGKAFCAGGDIKKLYDSIKTGENYSQEFFEKEYTLDYTLHNYPKPTFAWFQGFIMGGGMGIAQGCDFKIATDSTKLAMPEITIGLYPDVGASHFLRRKSVELGKFLGLTAARLNGREAVYAGLADYCVSDDRKAEVFANLLKVDFNSESVSKSISKIFDKEAPVMLPNNLEKHTELINKFGSAKNLDELYSFAEKHKDFDSKFFVRAMQTFLKGSPTTTAIVLEQFKRAESKSLAECFAMEWNLSVQCSLHHDFPEGIRALIIEKDNTPAWNPEKYSEIKDSVIQDHFKSPQKDGANPLENLK